MKIRKDLLYFIICLTILPVWSILFSGLNIISGNIWSALYLASLFCGVYFAIKINREYQFESKYLKFVFILLCFYNLTIIGRGIPYDYNGIKETLQSAILFWPFVIPIFVFFDKDLDNFVQLLKLMYYVAIAFLLITVIYPSLVTQRNTAETFIHPFAFGAGFLLMNAKYLSNKKIFISLLACVVAILSFTYLARRNAILTFSGFMLSAMFLYVKEISFGRLIKFFPIVAALMILMYSFSDIIPDSFTSRLTERALEDTRTGIFDSFFKEMSGNWIFGKGMNGTYYFPFNDTELDDGTVFAAIEYRNLIETGYLQLILNGGLVEVFLFVLILFPAALLGIFKSSNSLTRSCGMIIALWLIDMAVYGLPTLNLQYIFVWICVGICYKKSFREIPEEEIYDAFKNIGLA